MTKMLTPDDVRELLRREVNGLQKAWADEHGVSPTYVSDVLLGRKEPGRAIYTALGLERVTTYRKASEQKPERVVTDG